MLERVSTAQFQFYYGSINSLELNMRRGYSYNFNSTMVQLIV